VAGVVVGALLADRGDELLPALRRRRRRADDDTTPPAPRPSRTRDGDRAAQRAAAGGASPIEVQTRVLETFRNDPILLDRPIDIDAIGTGIVELTGWVDSAEEIRHATTLARGTIGVSTVVNRLAVRSSTDRVPGADVASARTPDVG
jgi:hypothetical protein